MKLTFKDINNENIYNDCKVMFVTGQYDVFNNIVVDRYREKCSIHIKPHDGADSGLLSDFGFNPNTEIKVSNNLELNTFMTTNAMPGINGLWFCSSSLDSLTKKQLDWLKIYIKKPSENGILVLSSKSYKYYKPWLSNRIVLNSQDVGIIQLSFPDREILKSLVVEKFSQRNVIIQDAALDLFIVRMSSSYDDYDLIMDKICSENLPLDYLSKTDEKFEITYDMAFESLRGIENFVIDDFIVKLTDPLSSDNITGRKPVFKIMNYLVQEYGARKLVGMLLKKINELIEFRLAINDGYIPVIVNYNVAESKKLLGESSSITKKSDYQFKRLSRIAARTSLKDWLYMQMILMNTNKFSEESYSKALYNLVTRSVLTPSNLSSALGMDYLASITEA